MAKVRHKDTSPELLVRKFLHSKGLRYRLHVKNLPGTPDIVLKKYMTVVFVNGCYWHGHGCRAGKPPKSNVEFWMKKVKNNRERDRRNIEDLNKLGYKVLTVWTCNLRSKIKYVPELELLYESIVKA